MNVYKGKVMHLNMTTVEALDYKKYDFMKVIDRVLEGKIREKSEYRCNIIGFCSR